ncbi:hypothetical protein [Ramlibacter albus]|uniref:Calcium-binding protein n=1 Tax=Ramlibacter albus TaxID=2079448 RepID=A0A923MCV4_9BURK|nr:hypothetical protein [Ramlibacter albus]MBC5768417.1 hypothetical protein [Ramlibacter albus]
MELKDANGVATGQWAVAYVGANAGDIVPLLGVFNSDGTRPAGITGDTVVSSRPGDAGYVTTSPMEITTHMAASNGRLAVVWSANSQISGGERDLFMRVFSNDLKTSVAEFRVNASVINDQVAPKVAALADGSFLVTWAGEHAADGQDGDNYYDVYMQRFTADASGNWSPASAADQLVTNLFDKRMSAVYNYSDSDASSRDVAQQLDVVGLAGGGWVVTYLDRGKSDTNVDRNVLGNIYDAAGNLVRGNIQLATAYSGTQEYYPTLSPLANGGFAASWTSDNKLMGDASGTGTYLRYFDETGNVIGLDEFQAGRAAIAVEPQLLVGGSTEANQANANAAAADPTFVPGVDGLLSQGDETNLWKAEVTILELRPNDVLTVDTAVASNAGITATWDATAGTMLLVFSAATTIDGIEATLRTVKYSGGASATAGERTIEFVLTDNYGATSTLQSVIDVESPALTRIGTAGNDNLVGANGNDGLIGYGGIDTLSGGDGDDRLYVSDPAVRGQYDGGQGTDTLVLAFSSAQTLNLSALNGHAHGIERLNLGNNTFTANNIKLRIDDVASITSILDTGVSRLLVQGDTADSVDVAHTLGFKTDIGKVASFDGVDYVIYASPTTNIQLWLQQGIQVTV